MSNYNNTKKESETTMIQNRADLLGEIVTWSVTSQNGIPFPSIVSALQNSNLDEKVARALAPRNAFSRACRALTEQRIIRKIREDDDEVEFQFTRETSNGSEFQYSKETTLTLRKATGAVSCPVAALEQEAQQLVDYNVGHRSSADVTRIIQKLFETNAGLFAIRDQGGAYFVPNEHDGFVDAVENFVNSLGGKMKRFPVPKGTKHGNASAKDAIAHGLEELIAEHEAAINSFGTDTRDSTFDRCAERIKTTKFKLENYRAYLDDKKELLDQKLDAAKEHLEARFKALAEEKEKEQEEAPPEAQGEAA